MLKIEFTKSCKIYDIILNYFFHLLFGNLSKKMKDM